MRQPFTYRDAVALLGGESPLFALLDKGSAAAMLGLSAIDLFDARAEAVRLGDGLVRGLRDRVKGLHRYDRTQRLAAAHAVIVLTAFFEVLGEAELLSELTRADLKSVGVPVEVHPLIDAPWPMPGPQRPYELVLDDLLRHYSLITDSVLGLASGLVVWDELGETRQDRLARDLPLRAVRRYEELFRRLVADFPEVACWASLTGERATRHEVRTLARGLAGLHERLSAISSGRSPSDRLRALVEANRAALGRPVVSSADVPGGMTIPSLDLGYVDPGFRVIPPWAEADTGPEHRDDLDAFLTGHLTLPQATDAPLLVLGQPGAGKSVLTRVLAARLPEGEFLPLRVELRHVPADADVLAQIEHGLRDALDEAMSWPELVQAAAGALPVVMLDGFDELLQATGVNQSDYLERVAAFQRRQAERGRALAVVVTSRTAVADRARIPKDSVVLRLEPFDEDRVRQWVTTWNHSNSQYFTTRGLQPLPLDVVLSVPDLAGQPLLLLMLALYDADANALRRLAHDLDEADLYERLLHGFAAREVRKSAPGLAGADLARAVEQELLRLSVTAFAMFNRGRQWIGETDLDADLRALLGSSGGPGGQGFRRPLTPAESVIGGFFFVHATQASRDDERLRTYEFLHATFGEYLVARLVVRELADLADELALAASRNRPSSPGDAFLHALLSFAALAGRAPVAGFLQDGVDRLPADRRALLRGHLCGLFASALMPRPGSVYDDYQPVAAEVTARYAAYSANLLLLAVLAADGPVPGTELFAVPQPEAANEAWRRIARLWHSQLARPEWQALIGTIRVRHFLRDGVRHLEAGLDEGQDYRLADLVFFTWPGELTDHPYDEVTFSPGDPVTEWAAEIAFRDDTTLGHLFVNLLPYALEVGGSLAASPFPLAADLLFLRLGDARSDDRHLIYRRALTYGNGRYQDLVIEQLRADCELMPAEQVRELLHVVKGHPRLEGILERLDQE